MKRQVIAHIVQRFDPTDHVGHTISTIARNVPGSHHLICGSNTPDSNGLLSSETVAGPLAAGVLSATSLRPVLEEIGASAVHVHGDPLMIVGAQRVAAGRHLAATIHSWPTIAPAQPGMRRRDMWDANSWRALANQCVSPRRVARTLERAVVFTPDHAAAALLRTYGITPSLYLTAVAPSLDGNVETVRRRIVFSARAELSSGADVLIEAMRLLHDRGVDVTATLTLSPGRHMAMLCDLARHNPAVEITTTVANPEGALAAVFPHRHDSRGESRLLAETALANATPVITTRAAAAHSTVDSTCAFEVEPGDPYALAAHIQALASSDALRYAYGANALTLCRRNWDMHGLAETTHNAYATWVENGQ